MHGEIKNDILWLATVKESLEAHGLIPAVTQAAHSFLGFENSYLGQDSNGQALTIERGDRLMSRYFGNRRLLVSCFDSTYSKVDATGRRADMASGSSNDTLYHFYLDSSVIVTARFTAYSYPINEFGEEEPQIIYSTERHYEANRATLNRLLKQLQGLTNREGAKNPGE